MLGPVVLLACVLVVAFVPLAHVDLKIGDFGTPVLGIIVSTAICWGLTQTFASLAMPSRLTPVVSAFATTGITVVLVHTLVITLMSTFATQPKWILLASLIVPWALALIVQRTPLAPLAIGAAKPSSSTGRAASP